MSDLLPCDFTVGVCTFKKGVSVDAAQGKVNRLYQRCLTAETELEKLRSPTTSTGWQTIETAPRDGRWILAFVAGATIPGIVKWEDFTTYPDKFQSDFITPRWLGDVEGEFESDDHLYDYLCGTRYEPTHWMPLPSPPTSKDE